MARTLDEAGAKAAAASSEWATALLGGEPSAWSVMGAPSGSSKHAFRVVGLKGEVLVSQRAHPDGSPALAEASSEAIVLTSLADASNLCTGVMPFEFLAETGVLMMEARRSFSSLSTGNARGVAYPSMAAHVGAWLARHEAASVVASLGSGRAGNVRSSLLPPALRGGLPPLVAATTALQLLAIQGAGRRRTDGESKDSEGTTPDSGAEEGAEQPGSAAIGEEVAAALTAAVRGSHGFQEAEGALRVAMQRVECVTPGRMTATALLVAPPGARATGDFVGAVPSHGSADGSAAAATAATADLSSILGSVAGSGGLVMTMEDSVTGLPKTAEEAAADVARATASQLRSVQSSSASSSSPLAAAAAAVASSSSSSSSSTATGAGGGVDSADDGSVSLVTAAPLPRATARGYSTGQLLASMVVAAAAQAVRAEEARAAAESAGGYRKHVAVQQAAGAARKESEAVASCGALIASYSWAVKGVLGEQAASDAVRTACVAAGVEILRLLSLPAPHPSLPPEEGIHAPFEVVSLPEPAARAACGAIAAAAARLLATSAARSSPSALLRAGASASGAAVQASITHALRGAAMLAGPSESSATDAVAAWVSQDVPLPYSLVVIAKPPRPGRAKTRIAAEMLETGAAETEADANTRAADVAQALLSDTVRGLSGDCRSGDGTSVDAPPAARIVYVAGDEEGVEAVRRIVMAVEGGSSWAVLQHVSGSASPGLDEVMEAATEAAQRSSPGPAVFIGTDMPSVGIRDVVIAARKASVGTATLLPARDGGYVVAALPPGSSGRQCFRAVRWSVASTFSSQAACILGDPAVSGMDVPESVWVDIDDLASLREAQQSSAADSRLAALPRA